MIRIGIDARLAVGRRRGMGRVLFNLVLYLSQIDKENKYFLYLDRPDTEQLMPRAPNFETHFFPPRLYPIWEQICLPLFSLKDKVQILHCPANTFPLALPRKIKLIVTIYDLIYLKPLSEVPFSRSMYQNLGRMYRALCTKALKKRVDLVITVSEWSRQELIEKLRVEQQRIRVIYNGVDDQFFNTSTESATPVLRRLGINFPYILHLGAIAPHKNSLTAIKAFHQLTQHPSYAHLRLVIVGLSLGRVRRLMGDVFENGDSLKKIVFLGYVSDYELASLFKGAELLLLPSLYEGFGLPALEAMACGTPVVASNRAAIPEVTAGAALLVDPTRLEDVSCAMRRVLENTTLRSELTHAGKRRAMQFRWEAAARKLLTAYKEVLEE